MPLYFAAERPVVERDGTLIMVDDERMPLEPGEKPAMTQGAVPHARLLSATGAVESDAETLPEIIREMLARLGLRAPGPRDRPRQRRARWRRRSGRDTSERRSASRDTARAVDMAAYLAAREHKGLLRFITCGSVDDGKSTLIGRLLYESGHALDDQLAALHADSKRIGTQGGDLDFALLLDGLAAEREQGITIDVAYRYFSTDRRNFIVADTPGHEQYTRNMATGASTADCAVDPRRRPQGGRSPRRGATRSSSRARDPPRRAGRHQDGPRRLRTRSRSVRSRPRYREIAAGLGSQDVMCDPAVRAARATTSSSRSETMPWYDGPDAARSTSRRSRSTRS